MSGIFEQVKKLYDQQLYSNVVSVVNLLLTYIDHNPECINSQEKFQLYTFYADSLLEQKQYRRAEVLYRKALQFYKNILKSKGTTKSSESQKDITHDLNIRYNLYVCYVNMNQIHTALSVLHSVPVKQRTPKINMALGKLYLQNGMEHMAIFAYKAVLRECPLALEAAEGLLKLSEQGTEVNTLIIEAVSSIGGGCAEWLTAWSRSLAHMSIREYISAANILKQLDSNDILGNNALLLTTIGECLYKAADFKNALRYLQRAHSLDPLMQKGIDIHAVLLSKENRHKEIEKLINPSLNSSEYTAENWIALAYHMHALKRWSRAAFFAQKGCLCDPRNVEALILKGTILYDLKKYQDAIQHFREAMQVYTGYDAHKGLVDCYVATHRLREAISMACAACMREPSPRTYTLYASVLAKDPLELLRAKEYLQKALVMDETYLPAVYLLAELYERELTLEPAIELLEKQLQLQSTCKLHQMLGDFYARTKNEEKAVEHFSIALNLDPNNRRAIEGLHRIDHASSSSNKLDSSSYCMTPTTADVSRNETVTTGNTSEEAAVDADVSYEGGMAATSDRDAEDSETEAVWSDMDLEVGGSQ